MDTFISPLDRAIAHIGSLQALADALEIRSPSISEWRKRGRVPAERCLAVEHATGGAVTRYELRPDVFGEAPAMVAGVDEHVTALKRGEEAAHVR